jgi:hypothetical protein
MLIDVPSDAHRILFRVQSFFTIEEPRACESEDSMTAAVTAEIAATNGGGKNLEVCERSDFARIMSFKRTAPQSAARFLRLTLCVFYRSFNSPDYPN